MDISVLIAIVSGLLQLLGYAVYNYLTHKGDIKPNSASWAIWTFGSLVNLMSYAYLTQDWVKDILPIACSAACFITFAVCLCRGQFGRLDKRDWIIVAVDCGITVIWFFTSATEANLLYQVTTVLSFVPIIIGIRDGTDKENWQPWVIWTFAYLLFGISVFMRLNHPAELAYPVTCFVVHCITAYLSYNRSP